MTEIDSALLQDAWTEVLSPPSDITIQQWCENNVVIPRRAMTPHPGPYRTDVTPWVAGWFEALQDPDKGESNLIQVRTPRSPAARTSTARSSDPPGPVPQSRHLIASGRANIHQVVTD